jgi:hypothetical protein
MTPKITEEQREQIVNQASDVFVDFSDTEEQLSMLVDLYEVCFTSLGKPASLPHPETFHHEVYRCWDLARPQ